MSIVVYVSSSAGVRKTMDNCKFITDTFDILKIKYTTVDLAITPEKRPDMEKNSGKKVVPQVFINDKYIGGFDEIEDWNENEVLKDTLKEHGYVE